MPANIEKLTGITNQALRERGISKTRLCCDIARMIGFEDEAYFSRAYKKIHGISPQAARAKLSK